MTVIEANNYLGLTVSFGLPEPTTLPKPVSVNSSFTANLLGEHDDLKVLTYLFMNGP